MVTSTSTSKLNKPMKKSHIPRRPKQVPTKKVSVKKVVKSSKKGY